MNPNIRKIIEHPSTHQAIHQSSNQPINQPINQYQPININPSIKQSTHQSTSTNQHPSIFLTFASRSSTSRSNQVSNCSESLKMSGSKKFKRAHSSCKLFFLYVLFIHTYIIMCEDVNFGAGEPIRYLI
jgi:hypothetical protein